MRVAMPVGKSDIGLRAAAVARSLRSLRRGARCAFSGGAVGWRATPGAPLVSGCNTVGVVRLSAPV